MAFLDRLVQKKGGIHARDREEGVHYPIQTIARLGPRIYRAYVKRLAAQGRLPEGLPEPPKTIAPSTIANRARRMPEESAESNTQAQLRKAYRAAGSISHS